MVPTLTEQLGTITAIVAVAIGLVEVLKVLLTKYKVGIASSLPTPILCVAVSMALTLVGNLVLKSLPGQWYDLLWQAALAAGAASGFFSWAKNGLGSPASRTPLFLFLGLSMALTTGCAYPTGMYVTAGERLNARKAELLQARAAYDGVANALLLAGKAGAFKTKADAAPVQDALHAGLACLDRWEAIIELDGSPAAVIVEWNKIIQDLVARRIAAQRDAAKSPTASPLSTVTPLLNLRAAA